MWAEDDFSLPSGVVRLGQSEPQDGYTYIMYHGTTKQAANQILNTGFRQSAGGMLGRGVYLSRDLQKASRYPLDHPENQRVVIRVKVNVGKVKRIDSQYHALRTTWHENGYDTAWVPPNCGMVKSGLEEDCVWDPNRITVLGTIQPQRQQRPHQECRTMWPDDYLTFPNLVLQVGLPEPQVTDNYIRFVVAAAASAKAQENLLSGFDPHDHPLGPYWNDNLLDFI